MICGILVSSLSAQSDPITEIQGRLALYHTDDTTSVHLGLDAGKSQSVTYERGNTFIGSGTGSDNTVGCFNTVLGTGAGLTNLCGDNTFVGTGVLEEMTI